MNIAVLTHKPRDRNTTHSPLEFTKIGRPNFLDMSLCVDNFYRQDVKTFAETMRGDKAVSGCCETYSPKMFCYWQSSTIASTWKRCLSNYGNWF